MKCKKTIFSIVLLLFVCCSCILTACGTPINSITYLTTDGKTHTVYTMYSHLITGIKIKSRWGDRVTLLNLANSKYSDYLNRYYYISSKEKSSEWLYHNPFDIEFGMHFEYRSINGNIWLYSVDDNCPIIFEFILKPVKTFNPDIKNEGTMSKITYYSASNLSKTIEPKKSTISVSSANVTVIYM